MQTLRTAIIFVFGTITSILVTLELADIFAIYKNKVHLALFLCLIFFSIYSCGEFCFLSNCPTFTP
jgi:hypothetical protein